MSVTSSSSPKRYPAEETEDNLRSQIRESSPPPKVVVTEAIKIGSGKKSPVILSPEKTTGTGETFREVRNMTPPKGIATSPTKENIVQSLDKTAFDRNETRSHNANQEPVESVKKSSPLRNSTEEGKPNKNSNLNNDSKKPSYQINIGNKNTLPTTSFADSGYVENSLVASMFERTEEDERNPKSQHKLRSSEPVSPNTEFGKIKVKMYSAAHSPNKGTENNEDEDPVVIQDTPTLMNNKNFKEKLTKAFLQAEDSNTNTQPIGKDMLKRKETGQSESPKQLSSIGNQSSPKGNQSSQKASRNISLNDLSPGQTPKNAPLGKVAEKAKQMESMQRSPLRDTKNPTRSEIWPSLSGIDKTQTPENRTNVSSINNFTAFPEGGPLTKIDYTQELSNQIIKGLRKGREKFNDVVFLPSITSLVNSRKNNKRPDWANFQWFRLSELYKQYKPTLYEEITPLSIRPGVLQNYNFLSVVATLSEYPQIVRNIILNQAYNTEGCYSVNVCRDGIWKSILVDDFVPCLQENNKGAFKPAFLRAQNNDKKIDLWQIILEKAWAKVFETYENLESTSVQQMLRDSLGAPCEIYPVNDMERTWNVLSDAINQGHIVLASIDQGKKDKLSPEEIYKRGLNPYFANTILDISLTRNSPSETRTIKMRNIWNDEFQWKSEYKETNSEKLQQEKIIFMTLKEFLSIFTHITVCRYNENYIYRPLTMRHVHKAYSIARFTCDIPMECFFELTQIDHRFYRGHPNYQYSVSRFLLFKQTEEGYSLVGGNLSKSKYNTLKTSLSEGTYYAIGIVDWKHDVYDFTLSAYGEGEVRFERIHYRDNPDLIANVLSTYLEQTVAPKSLNRNPEFCKYEKAMEDFNLKVELYANKSSVKTLGIRKKVLKEENSSLLNAVIDDKNSIEIQVQPQQEKIILVGAEDISRPISYQSEDIIFEVSK